MWPARAQLDRIVTGEIARVGGVRCRCVRCSGGCCGGGCGGACGCGCTRCGNGLVAHEASAARRATRATTGGAALPGWRGWGPAIPLSRLIDPNGRRVAAAPPRELAAFFRTGRPAIYRITREGVDRARPLYIGMVELNNSIAERVRQHFRTSAGDWRVRQAIQNLPASTILVQAARLSGVSTVAAAHVYEGWLSMRERPLIYDSSMRTFDEASYVH